MVFWQVHNEPWTRMVTVYSNIRSFEKKKNNGRRQDFKQKIANSFWKLDTQWVQFSQYDWLRKEVLRPLKAAQKIQEER